MPVHERWLLALALTGLTLLLGYGPGQSDFGLIMAGFVPFFLIYQWVARRAKEADVFFWIWLGMFLRASLLPAFPRLSDDIFRFIWDGRLLLRGLNPFDHLPVYYLEAGHEVPGLTAGLFEQLNSPAYFSVYPPLAQGAFFLAVFLSPASLSGSAVVLKFLLLACEGGSSYLLPRLLKSFGLPAGRALWYVLNPLVIIEVCGNLHFEGAMVFFFLLALWWGRRGGWAAAAVSLSLSVAAKLLPLMFFPFFIRRLGWGRSLWFFAMAGAVLLLLFMPLFNGLFLSHFGSSLDLYFRRFEFNASVYYLARWVGFQVRGYNLIHHIGPALALTAFSGILMIAFLDRGRDWRSLPGRCLWAIVVYLFLTTTVHPWYTILPLVLCLFTPWRFPILWSGLIFLTYINYSYPVYHENLWIVGIEYAGVLTFMGWESRRLLQGKTV